MPQVAFSRGICAHGGRGSFFAAKQAAHHNHFPPPPFIILLPVVAGQRKAIPPCSLRRAMQMAMERGVLFAPLLLLVFLVSSFTLDWWWGLTVGEWDPPAVPFRPKDILPILPMRVSRPLLYRLKPSDLVPTFMGGVAPPPNSSLQWKGACFRNTIARLELHNDSGSPFGGGKLHIKTSNPHSWTCMDLYIFATPYRVTWEFYFFAREHTFDFKEWEGEAEYEYVKQNGISVFLMEAGMIATLRAISDVFPLFSNTVWGENLNLDFLQRHMGASFIPRPHPWVSKISTEDLHSGDLFILSKIRGRWGGFETLEKWVTGSYAGHSAVCLRDSDGKLWIGESGHETGKGVDIIAVLPWEEWWDFEVNKDESNPHIALLPLHPDVRAKFNETAAWEYARSLIGTPYGYHNMIFSWIDTIDGNYPQPLDSHLVASFMTVWNHLQPTYAPNLWNEALNKRLGTEGLSFPDILAEIQKSGFTFNELMAIPEQDDWNYSDGKSLSCISFILGMYKAAGLFGPLASSIQVTEFTIKDAYTLKFFEDNITRLPQWCKEGDGTILPFCQVLGKYRMEVPGYNTILPYSHMNERCPSLPPDYDRLNGC